MPDISAGLRHRTTQAVAFGLLSSVVVALLGSLLFAGPVGAEVASSAGGAPVGLGTPAAGDAGDTKGVDVGTEAQAPSPVPDQAPAPGHAAPATPMPGSHRSGDPASVTTVTGPSDGEVQDEAPDLRPPDPHAVAQLEVDGRRGPTPAGHRGPGAGQASEAVHPREYLSAGGGQTIALVGPSDGGGEGPATAAKARGTTNARPIGEVVGVGHLRAGLLPGDDRLASGIEALQGPRGGGDGAEAGGLDQADQAGAPNGGLARISLTDQAPPPGGDASAGARAARRSTGGVADLTDVPVLHAVAGPAGPARSSGTEEMSSGPASGAPAAAPSHPGWRWAGISTGTTTGPSAGANGAHQMARAFAGAATAGAFPMAELLVVGELATTAAASGRVSAGGSPGQVRTNIVLGAVAGAGPPVSAITKTIPPAPVPRPPSPRRRSTTPPPWHPSSPPAPPPAPIEAPAPPASRWRRPSRPRRHWPWCSCSPAWRPDAPETGPARARRSARRSSSALDGTH